MEEKHLSPREQCKEVVVLSPIAITCKISKPCHLCYPLILITVRSSPSLS